MITWWNKREGFTLVELLVVIAIIGILATLLILQLGVARQRARDAQRVAHVNQIRTGLEFYFDSNGSYPPTANIADVGVYLQGNKLPDEPSGGTYGYLQISNIKYHLWAELEQKASAHASDLDYDSSTSGGVVGGPEVCADSDLTDNDCIYDVGQVN
jgi:prepilin-type N-terminal cleavage/methylation domain-containing protein